MIAKCLPTGRLARFIDWSPSAHKLDVIPIYANLATMGAAQSSVSKVTSADGTSIAFECAGAGPSLLIVHSGTGDRKRWTPLFPLLAPKFRVCAMDRRAHGASGDTPPISLQKEVEDVVAVFAALPGPVFVLGHSFGAVCAFEAAFQTAKIAKLALSEPPVRLSDHAAILARMEAMMQRGDRDGALTTFMREIVMISAEEVAAMCRNSSSLLFTNMAVQFAARPCWPSVSLVRSTGERLLGTCADLTDPTD